MIKDSLKFFTAVLVAVLIIICLANASILTILPSTHLIQLIKIDAVMGVIITLVIIFAVMVASA